MSLRTTEIGNPDDIRKFFDQLAPLYRDRCGRADRSLRYRLGVINRLMQGSERGCLVEIGCGTGTHLFGLAEGFRRVYGTDFSAGMIEQAERRRREHPCGDRIILSVDAAETLASVDDGVADVVLCVRAFEHMPDKKAVLKQVRRVLKRGGAFVCLTLNADWIWHTRLAPRLGLATTRLSSDRLVGKYELIRLLEEADLSAETVSHWMSIPRGDIPGFWAWLLYPLDIVGRIFRIPWLRGGLCCRAVK